MWKNWLSIWRLPERLVCGCRESCLAGAVASGLMWPLPSPGPLLFSRKKKINFEVPRKKKTKKAKSLRRTKRSEKSKKHMRATVPKLSGGINATDAGIYFFFFCFCFCNTFQRKSSLIKREKNKEVEY